MRIIKYDNTRKELVMHDLQGRVITFEGIERDTFNECAAIAKKNDNVMTVLIDFEFNIMYAKCQECMDELEIVQKSPVCVKCLAKASKENENNMKAKGA